MTKKEAISFLQNRIDLIDKHYPDIKDYREALVMAIKALEQQKPIEKFENAKDHIYKLAGDYKCWDNRLTDDEALELCHILEQDTDKEKVIEELQESLQKANATNSRLIQLIEGKQEPCEDAVSRKAVLNTLDNMDKVLDEDRTVENYKALLKECYEVLTPVTPTHTETVTEFADRCRECGREKVLDEIKATIEQSYCKVENDYDRGRNYGLYIASGIIDKYKEEMEK